MPLLHRATENIHYVMDPEPVLPAAGPTPWTEPVDSIEPPIEQHLINETLIVRFEMPGIESSDAIDVEVTGGHLRVTARRRHERDGFGVKQEASEFRYGTYSRDIELPAGAVERSVDASYRSGILTVRVTIDPALVTSHRVTVRRSEA